MAAAAADEFARCVDPAAQVRKLAGDMKFTEGPVWLSREGGFLVFSDIPADELKRWSAKDGLATFRKPSQNANGNLLDREGRMISCEHSGRRLSILEADGTLGTLVDKFEGKAFNSPNDVAVAARRRGLFHRSGLRPARKARRDRRQLGVSFRSENQEHPRAGKGLRQAQRHRLLARWQAALHRGFRQAPPHPRVRCGGGRRRFQQPRLLHPRPGRARRHPLRCRWPCLVERRRWREDI